MKKLQTIGKYFSYAIGNILEWFEFIIYASLTPILSQVFFPTTDKIVGISLTFTIFSLGFITRFCGGAFFGYIADKYGRRSSFILSIFMTGISALGITLLPGYHEIGNYASLLLLICRLLQGFSVGGEYPTLVAYITELAPPARRGFYGCYTNVTTLSGVLLATFVVLILTVFLTHEQMLAWGWRIPFMLTFISILIGFYIRVKLPESEQYIELQKSAQISKSPLVLALRSAKKEMIKVFFFTLCAGISYYIYNVFITSYLTLYHDFSYTNALIVSILGNIFLIVFVQIAGFLSDKVGHKSIIMFALIGLIIFSYPLFSFFHNKSLLYAIVVQLIFAIILSSYFAVLPIFIAEQFHTQIRCTGIGIAYNLSIIVAGGTAPLVNTLLIQWSHDTAAPGIYLTIAGIISLIATYYMKEGKTNIATEVFYSKSYQ